MLVGGASGLREQCNHSVMCSKRADMKGNCFKTQCLLKLNIFKSNKSNRNQ